MGLVGTAIGRLLHMDSGGEALLDIADAGDHRVGRLGGAHAFKQITISGQGLAVLPRHLEVAGGPHGVPFTLGDNADEIAAAHHAGRYAGDRTLVDVERLGSRSVGALPARAHHTALQHAGNADVLHVLVFGGDLVGNINARYPRADQPIAADRFLRRRTCELDVEGLVTYQLAVGDRSRRLAIDRHDAFRHRQAPGLHTEPRRSKEQ